MSRVTNVVLLTQIDETDAVDWINARLARGHFAQVDAHAGGTKAFEADVFLAAFNFIDHAELNAAVREAPWRNRGSVRMLIMGQEAEFWSDVHLWDDVPIPATIRTADDYIEHE